MSFQIKDINIETPVALGPMAGVTDLPFRQICSEMGCGLTYTEMVSAKAMYYQNSNTLPLLATFTGEHPVAIQLFGSEPEVLAWAVKKLVVEKRCDIIDLNMGCPVPKIVNNREGSALMKNPELVRDILTAMVSAAGEVPVTVKVRKIFREGEGSDAVEIAKIARDCGVSAIAVHGRTREQYYAGKADWEIIARVKEAVKIPVIGNGDIFTWQDALACRNQTGCDAVMVARGAQGNPWIFREIKAALLGESIPKRPTPEELREMMLRHGRMLLEYKGEYIGIREMRKHVAWYTTGLPHAAEMRRRINETQNWEELEVLLRKNI